MLTRKDGGFDPEQGPYPHHQYFGDWNARTREGKGSISEILDREMGRFLRRRREKGN